MSFFLLDQQNRTPDSTGYILIPLKGKQKVAVLPTPFKIFRPVPPKVQQMVKITSVSILKTFLKKTESSYMSFRFYDVIVRAKIL
jgi:hypothetical protein